MQRTDTRCRLSLKRELWPYLDDLQPAAHQAFSEVCSYYALGCKLKTKHPDVKDATRGLKEQVEQIGLARKYLKRLSTRLNKLDELMDLIEPLLREIRSRHISAENAPVSMLPNRDPVRNYFVRHPPDPTLALTNFFASSRELSHWLDKEIPFLKEKRKTLWEADPLRFFLCKSADYVLVQLFSRFSQKQSARKDILSCAL